MNADFCTGEFLEKKYPDVLNLCLAINHYVALGDVVGKFMFMFEDGFVEIFVPVNTNLVVDGEDFHKLEVKIRSFGDRVKITRVDESPSPFIGYEIKVRREDCAFVAKGLVEDGSDFGSPAYCTMIYIIENNIRTFPVRYKRKLTEKVVQRFKNENPDLHVGEKRERIRSIFTDNEVVLHPVAVAIYDYIVGYTDIFGSNSNLNEFEEIYGRDDLVRAKCKRTVLSQFMYLYFPAEYRSVFGDALLQG